MACHAPTKALRRAAELDGAATLCLQKNVPVEPGRYGVQVLRLD
jgi:hypothetical protein